MKITFAFLLSTILLANCSLQNDSNAQTLIQSQEEERPPSNCIWLYQFINYKGDKLEVCRDLIDMNHSNGQARFQGSVKVGYMVRVRVYDLYGWKDMIGETTSDIPNLATMGWQSKFNSLRLYESPSDYCVMFYELKNFQGYYDTICYGSNVQKMSTSFPGHNDGYSSVKIGSKVKAKIYEHENYGKYMGTISSHNFGFINWDNKISSVKIKLA